MNLGLSQLRRRGLSPFCVRVVLIFGLMLDLILGFSLVEEGAGAGGFSVGHRKGCSCEGIMLGEPCPDPLMTLFHSGQDQANQKELFEAAKHIYLEVAPALGYQVPNNVIRMVSASEMSALATLGRQPLPHAYEGLQIYRAAATGSAGGILEFVVGGPVHHQFIRDSNTFEESLIVLAHVVGHYDFAESHRLWDVQGANPVEASDQLLNRMLRWRTQFGVDALSEFYSYMEGSEYVADLARGTQKSSGEIRRELKDFFRSPQSNRFIPQRSFLQYLVSLPEHSPLSPRHEGWKREMLEGWAEMGRFLPLMANTKVMNEGWATLSEYLVLYHSKYRSAARSVAFAAINSGIRRSGDKNPYYLGSEVWFEIRKRFLNRPEIQGLVRPGMTEQERRNAELEQDRRFVAYVHGDGLRRYTDFTFLREPGHLSDSWFLGKNYLLYRPLTKYEQWENMAAGRPADHTHVVITVDPQRLREHIAWEHEFSLLVPGFKIVQGDEPATRDLVMEQNSFPRIPLSFIPAVRQVFKLSKLADKVVRLDTWASDRWWMPKAPHPFPWWPQPWWDRAKPKQQRPMLYPMTIRVGQDGKVTVTLKEYDAQVGFRKEDIEAMLTSVGQRAVDSFRESLELSKSHSVEGISSEGRSALEALRTVPGLRGAVEVMAQGLQDRADGLIASVQGNGGAPIQPQATPPIFGHARGRSFALHEFVKEMQLRLANALLRAFRTGKGLRAGRDGVSVGVWPSSGFQYDRADLARWRRFEVPVKPDARSTRPSPDGLAHRLETTAEERWGGSDPRLLGSDLPHGDFELLRGRGPLQPGDTFKLNPEDDSGDGNVTGDGESDGDGDPTDDPGEPNPEGEGEGSSGKGEGGNGGLIEVKIGYREFWKGLTKYIKLRNLRRTRGGEDNVQDEELDGATRGPRGKMHWRQMVRLGIGVGQAIVRSENEDGEDEDGDALRRGLIALPRDQRPIMDTVPVPEPDIDAVMVWVRDGSGSMTEDHQRAISQFVGNVRGVLKTVHPHLKERFVIYSNDAQEVDEKTFFTSHFGGGTNTVSGLDLAKKISEEYPRARFNRFSAVFSDGDDSDSDHFKASAVELAKTVEHLAYGHVDPHKFRPNFGAPLSQGFLELSKKHPDLIGAAELDLSIPSVVNAMKEFYGEKKK